MRKAYQFDVSLISLDNQMESFLAHEWPYDKARERARQERKTRLIDLAGFFVLFLAVALVAYVIAGERLGL